MSSNDVQKARMRRLQEHFRAKHGLRLSVSASYEAIASIEGYRDWNTYCACAPEEDIAQPLSMEWMVGRVRRLGTPLSDAAISQILQAALAQNPVRHLPFGTTQVGATRLALQPGMLESVAALPALGRGLSLPILGPGAPSSFQMLSVDKDRSGMSVLKGLLDFSRLISDQSTEPEQTSSSD